MDLNKTPDADLTAVLNATAETTYERLRRLYCAGSLTATGLANAVRLRLISQAEADQILAECPGA